MAKKNLDEPGLGDAATMDAWFQYPVVEESTTVKRGKMKTVVSRYAVKFQGKLLPLPLKPSGNFVEISARELVRCFSRH